MYTLRLLFEVKKSKNTFVALHCSLRHSPLFCILIHNMVCGKNLFCIFWLYVKCSYCTAFYDCVL